MPQADTMQVTKKSKIGIVDSDCLNIRLPALNFVSISPCSLDTRQPQYPNLKCAYQPFLSNSTSVRGLLSQALAMPPFSARLHMDGFVTFEEAEPGTPSSMGLSVSVVALMMECSCLRISFS